MIAVHTFQMQS